MSTERQDRVLGVTPLGEGHFRVVHGLLGVDGHLSHFCRARLFLDAHGLQGTINLLMHKTAISLTQGIQAKEAEKATEICVDKNDQTRCSNWD